MKGNYPITLKACRLVALLIVIWALAFFVGCSGGGGGGGSVDTTNAAGVWYGSLTDALNTSNDVIGVVSTNGKLRLLIDSGECAGTQYNGTFAMNGNTASGSFTAYTPAGCVFGNENTTTSGTIDFTISGINITGSYSTEGDSGTFNLAYDSSAEVPITLGDMEGHWGYVGPDNYFDITVC